MDKNRQTKRFFGRVQKNRESWNVGGGSWLHYSSYTIELTDIMFKLRMTRISPVIETAIFKILTQRRKGSQNLRKSCWFVCLPVEVKNLMFILATQWKMMIPLQWNLQRKRWLV